MLEEHGIAAHAGSKIPMWKKPLEDHQQQGDADDRSREDLNDAGAVDAPDEQGHIEPAHARGAELVNGDHEVQAGEDGAETQREGPHDHEDDLPVLLVGHGGVGRVESPAGIHAAEERG